MAAINKTGLLLVTAYLMIFAVQSHADPVDHSVKAPLASKSLLLDAVAIQDSLIVVGERGHILLSKDGVSWQQVEVPTNSTLTAVFFYNKLLGWAVGHDAVILRTIDGGQHWERVYYSPEDEAPLLDVWFRDEHNGLAIGAYSFYLVTKDGGKTWMRKEFTVTNNKPQDALESDTNHMADDDFVESYDLHLNSIARSDSGKLYIAAEAGRVYSSEDNGNSWKDLTSPYVGSFFGVQPLEDDIVLVYGLRGHMYRSDNAGKSWIKIATHTMEMLTHSLRLQDGTIFVVGLGGVLLVSKDNGKSFSIVELGTRNGHSAIIQNENGSLLTIGDNGITLLDSAVILDPELKN